MTDLHEGVAPFVAGGPAAAELFDLLLADAGTARYEAWRAAALADRVDPRLVARLHAGALTIRSLLDDRRRREQELVAVAASALELGAVRDVETLLRAIAERVRTMLRSDLAYLTLLDEDRGDVYVRVAVGAQTPTFGDIRLSLGAGLGGLVAATGTPSWTADMRTDARIVHTRDVRAATDAEGLVAVCAVPLLLGGRVVGVLYAAERRPRTFTHSEISLLSSLAAHAAVALDNARLFDETQSALGAARAAVDALERQAGESARQEALRRRLMEIAVHGGTFADAAQVIVAALGGSVLLLGDDAAVLAEAGGSPLADRVAAAAAELLAAPPAAAPSTVDDDAAGPVTLVPLVAHGAVLGVLAHEAAADGTADAVTHHRAALESSAIVLSLVLLARRAAREAEQRLRGEFLEELLCGRVTVPEARRQARLLGLALDPPYAVSAVSLPDGLLRRAQAGCAALAARHGGLAAGYDRHVAVLLPGDPRRAAETVRRELRADGIGCLVVGAAADGLDAVPAAFALATRTAAALRTLGLTDAAALPADLGVVAPLLAGADPAVLDTFVASTIGPLLDYDRRRDTALTETLRTVYDSGSGSSLHVAAAALHVHINTLHQRLDRINELLGGSWRDPDRALHVQLALLLHRLRAGFAEPPADGA